MKKIRFLIVLLLLASCSAPMNTSKENSNSRVSSKAQKWYAAAQEALRSPAGQEDEKAISLLKKATRESPSYFKANALLASLYNRKKAYKLAVNYFDKANQIDSRQLEKAYDIYAHASAGMGNFKKALRLINSYLEKNTMSDKNRKHALKWKAHYTFGQKSKEKNYPFNPVNMGDSINTSDPEYLPVLTIDGKQLIFTRKIHQIQEDFFFSRKTEKGWRKAIPFTSILFKNKENKNSHYNKGSETISQDGKWFLFTICDREDGLGSCDIYFSHKTDGGWSTPKNIGSAINSPYWDTQPSLSPDGKDLYFVSNRPGGYGGSDIYVSHLQSDGHWGEAVNLGGVVNTAGDESSPFIHADNRTLYFASDGHAGIGGVDLFYVRKKIDHSWGKVHNLGYPINTIDHDGSIFVKADGKTAFYASDRKDSRGLLDIYKFQLYPDARPVKTLYVQGRVFDKKTGKNIAADIVLTDLQSGKELTTINSQSDGHYLITLPVGKAYAFNVKKKGYLFYSAHFALQDSVKWRPFRRDIPLQPIEKEAHIFLENVFFDFDKYHLRQTSFAELDEVVDLLKKNPKLYIQINGYTDSIGTKSHNLELSQNRAQAVVDYLVSKGIDKKRLAAKGFGAQNPVASNETDKGRAENRRTELEITAK